MNESTPFRSIPVLKYVMKENKKMDISQMCKVSFDPNFMSRTVIQYLKQLNAMWRIKISISVYDPEAPMPKDPDITYVSN